MILLSTLQSPIWYSNIYIEVSWKQQYKLETCSESSSRPPWHRDERVQDILWDQVVILLLMLVIVIVDRLYYHNSVNYEKQQVLLLLSLILLMIFVVMFIYISPIFHHKIVTRKLLMQICLLYVFMKSSELASCYQLVVILVVCHFEALIKLNM